MTDLLGSALALVEAGASMQESEFYDEAMTGEGEPAMLPLERSPWRQVYDEAARCIPNSTPVVDLGCGTGRFLHRMIGGSHYAHLTGIDFSAAAVGEADSYLRQFFNDSVDYDERVNLEVDDLRAWEPDPGRAGGTVYTCLEVLEHLQDDLGLIRRVPAGHQFVFSVPNYLSASHVRAFGNVGDVFARYTPLLKLRKWVLVEFNDRNVVHVLDSVRRNDSW